MQAQDEDGFDPNAFLSDEKGDSYMNKYIILLFFIVIAALVGRVYYVRRQNERMVGFGGIKQVKLFVDSRHLFLSIRSRKVYPKNLSRCRLYHKKM